MLKISPLIENKSLDHHSKPNKVEKNSKNHLSVAVTRVIEKQRKDSHCLDLAEQKLLSIPFEIFQFPVLKQLYLEGNGIAELPGDFFKHMSSLEWLDLRHNQLACLPSNIGKHKCLKQLLLEDNNLKCLPVELTNVDTLTALNICGNPLIFPPKNVVEQGLRVIKTFLWNELMKMESSKSDTNETDESENDADHPTEATETGDKVTSSLKYNQNKSLLHTVQLSKGTQPNEHGNASSASHELIELFKKRMDSLSERNAGGLPEGAVDLEEKRSVVAPFIESSTGKKLKDHSPDENDLLQSENLESSVNLEEGWDEVKPEKSFEDSTDVVLMQRPPPKDDAIRKRMRLHSRKLRRRAEKTEETKPRRSQFVNGSIGLTKTRNEYMFKAFTGDSLPD